MARKYCVAAIRRGDYEIYNFELIAATVIILLRLVSILEAKSTSEVIFTFHPAIHAKY